ncbi:MAG TPA: hypothetical protein VJT73_08305 [Polyangiaceae bacterium]|nr:hypothetical protein [Polyangiaceae bacterium]
MRLAPIAIALFAFGACRAPLPPPKRTPPVAPKVPEGNSIDGSVMGPGDVPITVACTPAGAELCFDATDNNCNGLIDEGCGLQTGPVQFVIAWSDAADVDLDVTEPGGEVAKPGQRTKSGFVKEGDCGRPESTCHGQNHENVYFDGDRAPPGEYKVEIALDKGEDTRAPVKVTFGARIGGKTFAKSLVLDPSDETKTCGSPGESRACQSYRVRIE